MEKEKPITFEVSDKKYPIIDLPNWMLVEE